MHSTKRLTIVLLASILSLPGVNAAISLTITPDGATAINLTIVASGIITADDDRFLVMGTVGTDTFLPDGFNQDVNGSPTPTIEFAGLESQIFIYRDDDISGNFNGVDSLIGITFGPFPSTATGPVDLSELNGTYNIPFTPYSDFIPGVYTDLVPATGGSNDEAFPDLGPITLTIIPEPHSGLFVASAVVIAGFRRKRSPGRA